MSAKLPRAGAAVRSKEPAKARALKAALRSARPTAAGAAALRASSREAASLIDDLLSDKPDGGTHARLSAPAEFVARIA